MVAGVPAASTVARRPSAPDPASSLAEEEWAERPQLDLLDRRLAASRRRRASLARVGRRQVTLLRCLGVLFVGGSLAVTATAQALVASDQQRIDTLQGQLTLTVAEQQGLQVSRAELESPLRVLHIAEDRLGMVEPASASYLVPVNPGPTVAQAGETSEAASSRAARARTSRFAQPGASTTTTPARTPAGSHSITSPTR